MMRLVDMPLTAPTIRLLDRCAVTGSTDVCLITAHGVYTMPVHQLAVLEQVGITHILIEDLVDNLAIAYGLTPGQAKQILLARPGVPTPPPPVIAAQRDAAVHILNAATKTEGQR